MDSFNLRKKILNMTLSFYNNSHMNRDTIDYVIKTMGDFISDAYVPFLQQQIIVELKELQNEDINRRLQLILEEHRHPLKDFSSEHLRFKMYQKHSCFTHPELYKITDHITFEGDKIVNTTPIYGTYVSVKNILQNILQIPGLFNEVLRYLRFLDEEKLVISNIVQGKLWQNKYGYLNKEIVLPFIKYYDDFEPGNALGSHAEEQQLGGIYISLPFLPPHLVARLNNIFVLSVVYTKHRKLVGYRPIFQKIVQDINSLCSDGIKLNINGSEIKVYFRCVLVVGDNLGLNGACGFVESFNSNRYCRICSVTSFECQNMCYEDKMLLRTKENYTEDLEKNCISTGIKEECIFNNLIDFHVTENKSLDIMHDVCEGVIAYTLSKIITSLIETDKLFTLEILNQRIKKFDYGDIDFSNKPRIITKDTSPKNKNDIIKNKIKLKQSAAEMLCLCRYLGVIIIKTRANIALLFSPYLLYLRSHATACD